MSVSAMRWAYGVFEVIDIPPQERSVLLALCWDHTEKDGCYPTQDRLSLLTGYRERKVRDLLASLETQGFIRRERVKVKGKFDHTAYQLFGTAKRGSTGTGGPMDHRHKKAGRNHRQTGAAYRGIYTRGEVIELFVAEEPKKTGEAR